MGEASRRKKQSQMYEGMSFLAVDRQREARRVKAITMDAAELAKLPFVISSMKYNPETEHNPNYGEVLRILKNSWGITPETHALNVEWGIRAEKRDDGPYTDAKKYVQSALETIAGSLGEPRIDLPITEVSESAKQDSSGIYIARNFLDSFRVTATPNGQNIFREYYVNVKKGSWGRLTHDGLKIGLVVDPSLIVTPYAEAMGYYLLNQRQDLAQKFGEFKAAQVSEGIEEAVAVIFGEAHAMGKGIPGVSQQIQDRVARMANTPLYEFVAHARQIILRHPDNTSHNPVSAAVSVVKEYQKDPARYAEHFLGL